MKKNTGNIISQVRGNMWEYLTNDLYIYTYTSIQMYVWYMEKQREKSTKAHYLTMPLNFNKILVKFLFWNC